MPLKYFQLKPAKKSKKNKLLWDLIFFPRKNLAVFVEYRLKNVSIYFIGSEGIFSEITTSKRPVDAVNNKGVMDRPGRLRSRRMYIREGISVRARERKR